MIIEIFDDILKNYKGDSFVFCKDDDSLKDKCNAPGDKSCGVYIYTAIIDGREDIIYIGCSGHIENGILVGRKGGLKRRIYGKQDGVPRDKFYKDVMCHHNVPELKVYWYHIEEGDPEFVEYQLILRYLVTFQRFPKYNNKLEKKENKYFE